MREIDWQMSRRRFLLAGAGIAASVALAPSVLEALDRLAPRRLMIPAPYKSYPVNAWKEAYFYLSDDELRAYLDSNVEPLGLHEARRAIVESFEPGMMSPIRADVTRQYGQDLYSLDAIGVDRRTSPQFTYGAPGRLIRPHLPPRPNEYRPSHLGEVLNKMDRFVSFA